MVINTMNTAMFVISVILSFILLGSFSLGKVFALLDEDGRYIIVTLENVKSRDIEVTAYIPNPDSSEKKDKKIEGSPGPIDKTAAQVKHTFKFDQDDIDDTDVKAGTQFIVCLEFKSGAGELSCWTDTFKSESQPNRVTLDADYIRD
jgi:hypothetical protein